MRRIAATKRILKHFGIKIKVIADSDFYIEYDENDEPVKLAVQDPDFLLNDTDAMKVEIAQRQFTEQFCKEKGIPYNYLLFALLHEIGHLQTYTNSDKYIEETDLLSELFTKNMISHEDYVKFYNSIDEEAHANDWAASFIKENITIYQNFERMWA